MSAVAHASSKRDARSSGARPIALSAPPLPRTTPAGPPPARAHRLRRMSKALRIVLTGFAFAVFFGGSCVLGVLAGLYYRFRRVRPEDRWRFTQAINRSLQLFAGLMRDLGLIDYWHPRLPEGYEKRAFLLVANHPTLIDVVLLLASFPELSCVVKSSWYDSILLGPMLRNTEHVPGAGRDGEADEELPVVRRMEEKLRQGVPVLVFPEGTRSLATRLRRFRRGGIEAAVRAGAPILPLFIANDQPFLMKGVPFYRVPERTCDFVFEWLEPIETEGQSAREVARELAARYEARFAKLVAERSEVARSK